jgi:hypothetical protein
MLPIKQIISPSTFKSALCKSTRQSKPKILTVLKDTIPKGAKFHSAFETVCFTCKLMADISTNQSYARLLGSVLNIINLKRNVAPVATVLRKSKGIA